jgi:hypothetical protein
MLPLLLLATLLEPAPAIIEFYEEGNYGLRSDGYVIRVFAFDRSKEKDERIQFVGDLARGRHRLALSTSPGKREYIVIIEQAGSEAAPGETRSIARLQPNVRLEAVPGHLTRVRVGLAASVAVHGIDRRSSFGTDSTNRTPMRSRPAFESEEASLTTPSASQFSTDIVVEKPVPLSEN